LCKLYMLFFHPAIFNHLADFVKVFTVLFYGVFNDLITNHPDSWDIPDNDRPWNWGNRSRADTDIVNQIKRDLFPYATQGTLPCQIYISLGQLGDNFWIMWTPNQSAFWTNLADPLYPCP